MSQLTSDQIAELFSKGNEASFWLTKKQTSWIMGVWYKENPKANTHFGRGKAGGSFVNSNGNFRWDCNEGYHGSSMLKVTKVEDKVEEIHPLEAFAIAKGLDFKKLVLDNSPELVNLVIEFHESLKV